MGWNKDDQRIAGGRWFCIVRRRESHRRYREKNQEKMREQKRLWRKENPEKKRAENARRVRVGDIYLGTCGFTQTELEAMLSGTSE